MHWDYCPDGPGMPPRPVEPSRADRERAVLEAAIEYRRVDRVISDTPLNGSFPAGTEAAVDALERLEACA